MAVVTIPAEYNHIFSNRTALFEQLLAGHGLKALLASASTNQCVRPTPESKFAIRRNSGLLKAESAPEWG